MSIIRGPKPEKGWTSIANEALRDRELCWSDRGLLGYLLSLPEGARTDVDTLAGVGIDGRDGTRAALRRLQTAGYVRRVKYRGERGRFVTDTYVYDTRAAATEAIKAMGGVDVSAGQDHDGISVTVDPDVPEPAGQDHDGFTVGGQPQGGQPQGGPRSGKYLDLGEDQPTNPPPPVEPSPADLLAVAVMAGLEEVNQELAAQIGRSGLRSACQQLVDLQWTPLQIRAWVTGPAQNWAGIRPGGVIHRLRELGRPPEPPRSAVPARQDECPEHPGVLLKVAGTCDTCRVESTRVDPAARAAEVRAAMRPMVGSEPPTSPRGIQLPLLPDQHDHLTNAAQDLE